MDRDDEIKYHIQQLLNLIEPETNDREGLKDTPDRVMRMYKEIFGGYKAIEDGEVDKIFKAQFTAPGKDIVIVKDIGFYSHCEHHLATFFGKVHIAYVPSKTVLGLSKFGRLVEIYARQLQIQERLTRDLAENIQVYLEPDALMVMIEAEHLCVTMRGIKKQGTKTITSYYGGLFRTNPTAKQEVLSLLRLGG